MAASSNKRKSNGRVNTSTVSDNKMREILTRMDENISYLKGKVDDLSQRIKQLEQGK